MIKANNAKLAGIELRENETKVHFAHFALLHYSYGVVTYYFCVKMNINIFSQLSAVKCFKRLQDITSVGRQSFQHNNAFIRFLHYKKMWKNTHTHTQGSLLFLNHYQTYTEHIKMICIV